MTSKGALRSEADFYASWREGVGLSNPVYVYQLLAGDTLLYAGISVDPYARLADHHREKSWVTETTRVEIEEYPSEDAAREREAELIEFAGPVYNVAGNEQVAAVVRYLRDKYARDGCAGLQAGVEDLAAEIGEV